MAALQNKLRAFAKAVAAGDTYKNPEAVAKLLTAHNLVGKSLILGFTRAVTREY